MKIVIDVCFIDEILIVYVMNVFMLIVLFMNLVGVNMIDDIVNFVVKVAFCGKMVFCGLVVIMLLVVEKLMVKLVIFEIDVKVVLMKVEFDEVDVGLVYVMDVKIVGDKVK